MNQATIYVIYLYIYSFQFCSNLWTCLKVIQDEYPSMTSHSLDMTSVADLMDGRLVLTLFSLALEQRSLGLQGWSSVILQAVFTLINYQRGIILF